MSLRREGLLSGRRFDVENAVGGRTGGVGFFDIIKEAEPAARNQKDKK